MYYIRTRERNPPDKKKEFKDMVIIPYVAGLSEAIRRVGEEVGIKTVFSATDTLKKRLTHVKPKSKQRDKDVIYKIPCECGAQYIGETGRPLEVRVSEHRRNWLKLRGDLDNGIVPEYVSSLLAAHAVENKHEIQWEEVKVLATESNIKKRKIHEAAVMCITENVISQPSHDIPPLWHAAFREEKKNIVRERDPRKNTERDERARRGRKRRSEEDEGPREKVIRTAVGEKPLTSSAAVTRNAAVTRALGARQLRPRRETRKPLRLIESL